MIFLEDKIIDYDNFHIFVGIDSASQCIRYLQFLSESKNLIYTTSCEYVDQSINMNINRQSTTVVH